MRIRLEYDVNVLGTNHHPISWLSCIVNGLEKTKFHRYSTNDKTGNRKFYKLKYALKELKCATLGCRFSAKALKSAEILQSRTLESSLHMVKTLFIK